MEDNTSAALCKSSKTAQRDLYRMQVSLRRFLEATGFSQVLIGSANISRPRGRDESRQGIGGPDRDYVMTVAFEAFYPPIRTRIRPATTVTATLK